MADRVLVTYASRAGSTAGVATTIGETLTARGFVVDMAPIGDGPAVDGSQAVVIGSAVHGGRWLPEAEAFVNENRHALSRVPVALFSVHIMNLKDNAKSRTRRVAYLDGVRPLLPPADEAFFAGKMDTSTISALAIGLIRLFRIMPVGDHRDWAAVRGWAAALWSEDDAA